jgi:ribosome biogenesis GTPase
MSESDKDPAPELKAFGWDDYFVRSFAPYARDGYGVGRVFLQHNKIYLLYTARGETTAEVTGRLAHQARGREDFPAVGDWVVLRDVGGEGKKAAIHAVLPRRSKFSRKVAGSRTEEQIVAANVDTIFLVTGLDNDFNPRRIERYLIMARESGARPVVVLNKADLAADAAGAARAVREVAPDVSVVLMSAKRGLGVEELTPFIGAGQTVALLGSSGVGKSTIVNRLLGEDAQRTQEVRSGDDRGKHTTTHRELIILPTGGLIIDTPGMRELQLLVSDRGLRETFEDIETLAARCRFSDCRHADEPSCAIKGALADGTLSAARYESYRKMQLEMEQTAVRQNERAAQLEKGRDKQLTRTFNKTKKRRLWKKTD